jgi:hypothetical protein
MLMKTLTVPSVAATGIVVTVSSDSAYSVAPAGMLNSSIEYASSTGVSKVKVILPPVDSDTGVTSLVPGIMITMPRTSLLKDSKISVSDVSM